MKTLLIVASLTAFGYVSGYLQGWNTGWLLGKATGDVSCKYEFLHNGRPE